MTRARGVVVAIDGPAGAGKSTASRMLADRLGYTLVDTGAIYRAVALSAREHGIDWDDARAMGEHASRLGIAMAPGEGGVRVFVDGRDRTPELRTPEISQGASKVSAHPTVRDALLALQRQLGAEGGVVLEGRDIGTVVFPDAEVKVFLTAGDEERARRRCAELAAKGVEVHVEEVLRELRERDHRDTMRPVAPLKAAGDALVLDSTQLSLDEVVDRLVHVVRAAAAR